MLTEDELDLITTAKGQGFLTRIKVKGDEAWMTTPLSDRIPVPLKSVKNFLRYTLISEVSVTPDNAETAYKFSPLAFKAIDEPEVLRQLTVSLFH